MDDETKNPDKLILAIKDLSLQNKELEKNAEQLIIANKELAFQKEEKEKRAVEIIIANEKLAFQNKELEKCAEHLTIANRELVFQINEKAKRQDELILINEELKKAEEYQREYLRGLKEMMFITSHRVRQPISQIMGIFHLLEKPMNSQEDLEKITGYIKQSIVELDSFTRELTTLINDVKQKTH